MCHCCRESSRSYSHWPQSRKGLGLERSRRVYRHPPGNGATGGTFLIDGLWQGTWQLHDQKLRIRPFASLRTVDREALLAEAAELCAFIAPQTAPDIVVEHPLGSPARLRPTRGRLPSSSGVATGVAGGGGGGVPLEVAGEVRLIVESDGGRDVGRRSAPERAVRDADDGQSPRGRHPRPPRQHHRPGDRLNSNCLRSQSPHLHHCFQFQ